MFKLPQSIIYAMIAFNITAFTLILQMDMLVFNMLWAKLVAWALTIGAWTLVYTQRKKYFLLF